MTKARELAELGKAVSVHDNRLDFDRNVVVPGLIDSSGTTIIADGSITTAKIADDAVTSAKVDTNISIGGTLGVTGAVTANAGVNVDNITIDGQEIDVSTGSLTIDVASNIILDADDGVIRFFDGGTQIANFANNSSDLHINVSVQDKDFVINGNDGGSTIEALRIDMSEGGRVGIGATTVDRQLHLEADNNTTYSSSDFDQAYNLLKIENNNTTNNVATGLQFLVGTNGSASITTTRTGDGAASLCFGTRGGGSRAERMRISSAGNVGIGETSPQRALHVNGIGKFMRTVTIGGSTGSNNYIGYFTAEAFANNAGESNVTVGTFASQPLQFATNSTERMRINEDGRVFFYQRNNTATQHYDSYGHQDFQVFRFAMSMMGNQTYTITISGFGNGNYHFNCFASHWSGGYHLHRKSYLAMTTQAVFSEYNLANASSSSQGAFSFARPANGKINVVKTSGTYAGGMVALVEIKGKSNLIIDSIT
tara:strand:- start:7810 stop:9255 length:1446 start_codon:yes stop_codon:yes gene_type:complete